MKKLSLKEIRFKFEEKGWQLLDEVYTGSQHPLLAMCPNGHITKILWGNLQKGQGCHLCAKNKKLDFSFVNKIFSDRGCELLETKYINAFTKMNYRCSCGNKAQTTWNNFRKGKMCISCKDKRTANKLKHSYEQVFQYFSTHGCKLLDKLYINSKQTLNYQCSCGTTATITYRDFKKGRRCISCWKKRLSGENNHNWNPNKEEMKLNKLLHKKCTRALYSCLQATGNNKTSKTKNMLGYTTKELKAHITKHTNWGKINNNKWALDHIFPIKAFLEYKIYDLKLINSLDNLQPLSIKENISKGCKYNKIDFEKWLCCKGIKI